MVNRNALTANTESSIKILPTLTTVSEMLPNQASNPIPALGMLLNPTQIPGSETSLHTDFNFSIEQFHISDDLQSLIQKIDQKISLTPNTVFGIGLT